MWLRCVGHVPYWEIDVVWLDCVLLMCGCCGGPCPPTVSFLGKFVSTTAHIETCAVWRMAHLNSAAVSASPFPSARLGADSQPGPFGLDLCVLKASMLEGRSPSLFCRCTFSGRSQLIHLPCNCLTPRASSPAPGVTSYRCVLHGVHWGREHSVRGAKQHLQVPESAALHSRPLPGYRIVFLWHLYSPAYKSYVCD